MPDMSKKSLIVGKPGGKGVNTQGKIKTPFKYVMADQGPAKSGSGSKKRSSSKRSSSKY